MSDRLNSGLGVSASYDRAADVLYIVADNAPAMEGDGLPDGLELDYAIESGEPCGATVIGFHRYHWETSQEHLAQVVAQHMSVDAVEMGSLIQQVTAP